MQNKWVVGTEPRGICITQTLEVALTFPSLRKEQKYSLNHSSLSDSKVKSTLSLLYSARAQKIHKMVWVGMHFKDHLVPILLIWTGTPSPRMLRAHPNLSLSLPALQFAAISSLDNLAHLRPIFPSHLNPGSRAGDVRVAETSTLAIFSCWSHH